MAREREAWMDVLRGEMTLLVVTFHATSLLRYGEAPTPRWLTRLNNLTEPYWMPTLSFLSGMLLDRSTQRSPGEFYAVKVRTVLYPFAVWSAIYAGVFRVPANRQSAVKLASGGTYLFFLPFLFLFNAVSYPLRRAPAPAIGLLSLAVGATAPARLPAVPERFTARLPYLYSMFMLGRWAQQHPAAWARMQQGAPFAASLLAAGAGAGAATRGARVSYRWQWAWAPALATPALARGAKALDRVTPLRFLGEHSIVFYTAHFPTAYLLIRRAARRRERGGLSVFAAALAGSIAVPAMLALLSRRSRFARRLFSA